MNMSDDIRRCNRDDDDSSKIKQNQVKSSKFMSVNYRKEQ